MPVREDLWMNTSLMPERKLSFSQYLRLFREMLPPLNAQRFNWGSDYFSGVFNPPNFGSGLKFSCGLGAFMPLSLAGSLIAVQICYPAHLPLMLTKIQVFVRTL